MRNLTLLATLLGASFTYSALAEEATPASPHTITGNVGFVSDYVFNGISQNFRQPALQGGFDYANASGIYLGAWASAISGNQYTNASTEWDVYGGYNGKINEDLSYSAGLMGVFYPNGQASPTKKWDTTEFIVGATYKGLNIKYTQTISDWYGISTAGFAPQMWNAGDAFAPTGASTANSAVADSRGSGYIEANYSHEFADKLAVSAHIGHQKVRNFDLLNYSDYKLGVTKGFAGFVFGAAYTHTNATSNNLYVATNTSLTQKKELRGGIFAVSVSRSF